MTAFTIRCDCGLDRVILRGGSLRCSHCDYPGCDGNCTRCTAYATGIRQRVILDGGHPA